MKYSSFPFPLETYIFPPAPFLWNIWKTTQRISICSTIYDFAHMWRRYFGTTESGKSPYRRARNLHSISLSWPTGTIASLDIPIQLDYGAGWTLDARLTWHGFGTRMCLLIIERSC